MYFGWDVAELDNRPTRRFARAAGRGARWASRSSATATGGRTSRATSPSAPSSTLRRAVRARRARAASPSASASRASRCASRARRRPRRPGGRRGRRRDAAADPPRARQARAGGRQARARREAAGHDLAPTRASSSTLAEREDLVLMPGPHLRLQPGGQHGPRPDPRRRRGRGLLHHLLAHEPRQVPARRRGLRPRAARPLDPALLARRAGRAGVDVGPQRLPGRRPRDGVPHADLRERHARANIQVSWLAPRKVRQMVVVGSKRMVQYDDTAVRRARPHLRPRHGLRRGRAGELRRVPAHLPHAATSSSRASTPRAAEPRAPGLRAGRSARAPCPAPTPRSGSRSSRRSRPPRRRCAATAHPIVARQRGLDAAWAARDPRPQPAAGLHGPLLGLPHRLADPAPGAGAGRARRRGATWSASARPRRGARRRRASSACTASRCAKAAGGAAAT